MDYTNFWSSGDHACQEDRHRPRWQHHMWHQYHSDTGVGTPHPRTHQDTAENRRCHANLGRWINERVVGFSIVITPQSSFPILIYLLCPGGLGTSNNRPNVSPACRKRRLKGISNKKGIWLHWMVQNGWMGEWLSQRHCTLTWLTRAGTRDVVTGGTIGTAAVHGTS